MADLFRIQLVSIWHKGSDRAYVWQTKISGYSYAIDYKDATGDCYNTDQQNASYDAVHAELTNDGWTQVPLDSKLNRTGTSHV